MTKIYTRTGDDGETSLFAGGRVRKDHVRVAAYGTIDELNAVLGVVRNDLAAIDPTPSEVDQFVVSLQHQLFKLGAELATPQPEKDGANLIRDADVSQLEQAIDRWTAMLAPLREFILPGGCPAATQLQLARCVCRRGERLVVRLAADEPVRGEVLRYVNRLSDVLFVLARYTNRLAGVADVIWRQET
jgi:cob(I)alamin adenosyltransferase